MILLFSMHLGKTNAASRVSIGIDIIYSCNPFPPSPASFLKKSVPLKNEEIDWKAPGNRKYQREGIFVHIAQLFRVVHLPTYTSSEWRLLNCLSIDLMMNSYI